MSLESVECCPVEVSPLGWSLVQWSVIAEPQQRGGPAQGLLNRKGKKKINVSLLPPRRQTGGGVVQLKPFLSRHQTKVSGLPQAPAALPPRKNSVTRWTEGWVAPEPVWRFWEIKSHIISMSTLKSPPPKKTPRVNTDIGQNNNRFGSRPFKCLCFHNVMYSSCTQEAHQFRGRSVSYGQTARRRGAGNMKVLCDSYTHTRNWIPPQLSHLVNECTLYGKVRMAICALKTFFHIYSRPSIRESIWVHFRHVVSPG